MTTTSNSPTIPATFLPGAATAPDAAAITWPDGSITWAEAERRVRQYANRVEELGLASGDRVAVMSFNRPEWVIALLGNLLAGMRHVPVNWHLATGEVTHILTDSDAALLLVDAAHEEVGRAAARAADVGDVIVIDDLFAWLDGAPTAQELSGRDAGGILMYTSGTTGHQKGVVRSDQQRTIDRLMPSYEFVARAWGLTSGGRHLMACPMYHATPGAMTVFAVSLGQSLVLMPAFDAEEALRLIDEQRITTTHLVPTQLIRLLRLADDVRARYDVSSLTGIWHGAAPCPEWVKRAAIDWFGPIVTEYFGSSEGTGPLIATSEEWLAHPGTVGKPTPLISVSVVDDNGDDLAVGEVGTLYFKRPDGPPSYHGAPEKTAASRLADGRFTVGDIGWIDADGFVYLADRKIDMIISGGANIYPSEIEATLSEHPAVADCAVFGIPDDEWGEQVKAAVELAPGASATGAELIAYCRERIAAYKCPRSVDFHDQLPREASGKMKKRLLRDAYWRETGRRL